METQPKTRPGFLLKAIFYLLAGVAAVTAFSGRPDRLIQSDKNKAALPTLLAERFPTRNDVLSEFSEFHKKRKELQTPPDIQNQKEFLLRNLELYILAKVPWESDWRNWEVREYIPTPEEVIQKGKEDCDGRAILFTNLARALGQSDVQIIWSDSHVWTRDGEGNNYLLYAPSDYAETATERTVDVPEYGENPQLETQQTGDQPPPVTLKRGFLEQFTRDILSMKTNRFVSHIIASTAFLILAFCIPSSLWTKQEKA
jgi:hypothetical protein